MMSMLLRHQKNTSSSTTTTTATHNAVQCQKLINISCRQTMAHLRGCASVYRAALLLLLGASGPPDCRGRSAG